MAFRTLNLEHLDAAENYFFSREAEFISQELYRVAYAEGKTRLLLPIENSMGPNKGSYTWRLYDQAGKAKRWGDGAMDVPQVQVSGSENNQVFATYTLGYNYTKDEIGLANELNRPLDRDRATACRDGLERILNDVAADGDTDAGLVGFLGLSGTNTYTPANKAAGGSVGGTSWMDSSGNLVATSDEVIKDVSTAIRKVFVDSKEIETVTRVVLPTQQFAAIGQTPRSTGSNQSILEWLKANNPGVEFMSWERLSTGLNSTSDKMICYNPRPDKLKLLLPIEFEQEPPFYKDWLYRINCRMKCGGVIAHRPKSILIATGV